MDFEMDIPAAEELEWLESNSLLPEFEDEDEFIVEEEDKDTRPKEIDLSSKDPVEVSENEIHRKRVRSEEDEDEDEEASTKRRELEAEEDEDWLRYSPPKEEAAAAADVEAESAEEKIISRFVSEIEGDCIPVTAPNGDRVYAKVSSGEVDGGHKKFHVEKSSNGLLSEPIHALINGVEQDALKKALQQSSGSPSQKKHSSIPLATEQLWVDKYAPNSFTELLSDEQTNREVLLWLKQWDSCVFGSHIRATTDDVFSALRQHSSAQHPKLSDNRFFFNKDRATSSRQNQNLSNAIDRENSNLNGFSGLTSKKPAINCQPEHKVLLLCGSPGLGKTTLAHVAARHCGYRVVEINASDERSSAMIESKILDVVQMNSVMADSKPKCLVIDEIDGTLGEGKGAVEVILKMVADDNKSYAEKGNSPREVQPGKASSRKTKQRNAATLLRPVICICNDLYAPALRSLRQVAKVHTFVQPTISRVVNRLKYICQKEGFKSSSIALSALADFTECDIRSCLNTLQFLNKKRETLNLLEVGSQVIGRKDISRSAFDIWKEIFQKRKSKRERNSMKGSSGHGDFDFVYSLISNHGEYELTMDGIHENFLRLSYHDPMMQKTVRCLDTLGVSDSLLKYIFRTQQMSLYAYQPPIVITMRNLIAQFEKPNIEWPKSFQKCRAMLLERKDSLKFWYSKIQPSISRHLSVEYFVEDLISPLLHILSPPTLRPVALHLLTEREKNDLAQLVDTMVSYSLTYRKSKPEPVEKTHKYGTLSDTSDLSLDPPIDDFVRFQDCQSEHFGLSLAVKQVLVHEVEKHRILRESIGKSMSQYKGSNSTAQESPCENKMLTPNVTTSATAEVGHQPKMTLGKNYDPASTSTNTVLKMNKSFPANGMSSKALPTMMGPMCSSSNFFDRFRKGSSKDSTSRGENLQKAATMERDSRPLLFKYNEGFTNAVKRPVKIRELLL